MLAPAARPIRLAALAAAVLLPTACGCSTLFTAAYLLQPADVPAEFNGLKGSKLAVAVANLSAVTCAKYLAGHRHRHRQSLSKDLRETSSRPSPSPIFS